MNRYEDIIKSCLGQGIELYEESAKLKYRSIAGEIPRDILDKLKENREGLLETLKNNSKISEKDRYEPFPLSPVQSAYLFGRGDLYSYGNVACHIYQEYKYRELEEARVQNVWNKVINSHDMLKTIIYEEGYQKTLPSVPDYKVMTGDGQKIRSQLENKIYPLNKWPMFDIGVSQHDDYSILHFSMDFMICDWSSIWQVLYEFEDLYFRDIHNKSMDDSSFRTFILKEEQKKSTIEYQKDKKYWENYIKKIKSAPILPIRQKKSKEVPKFNRLSLNLDQKLWENFKNIAKNYGLTTTSAVLALYSETLKIFSSVKDFCLNITLFGQGRRYNDADNLLGDFTNTSIIKFTNSNKSFVEIAREINKNLFTNMDHSLYSGVEVLRDLANINNKKEFLMPYVFTSAIGLTNKKLIGKYIYGISQTPQVFIDCQAMDYENELQINWDIREGVFPGELIRSAFNLFEELIVQYSKNSKMWEKPVTIDNVDFYFGILEKYRHLNEESRKEGIISEVRGVLKNFSETAEVLVIDNENDSIDVIASLSKNENKEISNHMPIYSVLDDVSSSYECKLANTNYLDYFEKLDTLMIQVILETLIKYEFINETKNISPKVNKKSIKVSKNYDWIIKLWLVELEERNIVSKKGNDGYTLSKDYRYKDKKYLWEQLYDNWDEKFGNIKLLEYIKDSVSELENILTGEVNPVKVLYPEGSNKYQKALYQDSVYSKLINDYFRMFMELYLKEKAKDKIRILEIGGGIGATTKIITDILKGVDYEYYFTDVDDFFLSEARSNFRDNERLIVEKFDINKSYLKQGFEPNYFDIVISAYVLNNAKNLKFSINNIKNIVTPGGFILFSEPMENQSWLLTSQVFMMDQPEDSLRKDTFFITKDKWRKILDNADNSNNTIILPKNNSDLECLGAFFGVKNFKCDISRPNRKEIESELNKKVNNSIKINKIIYLNDEEMDPELIQEKYKYVLRYKKEETMKSELSGTEARVLDIIETNLGRKIERYTDNYFDIGANSLLLAKIAASIRESLAVDIPFDIILRELVSNPTYASTIDFILNYKTKEEGDEKSSKEDDFIKHKLYSKDENLDRLCVILGSPLFSNNDLKNFIGELSKLGKKNILKIGISDLEKYLKSDNKNVIPMLADKFVKEVENLGIRNIEIIGYSFGGLVALEVSRRLIENGKNIIKLSIIEGGNLPDVALSEFQQEIIFLQLSGFQLSDLGISENYIFKDFISENNKLNDDKIEYTVRLENMSQENRFNIYEEKLEHVLDMKNESLFFFYKLFKKNYEAQKYKPDIYFGDVDYYRTTNNTGFFKNFDFMSDSLKSAIIGEVQTYSIEGNHLSIKNDLSFIKRLARFVSYNCDSKNSSKGDSVNEKL